MTASYTGNVFLPSTEERRKSQVVGRKTGSAHLGVGYRQDLLKRKKKTLMRRREKVSTNLQEKWRTGEQLKFTGGGLSQKNAARTSRKRSVLITKAKGRKEKDS